MKFTITFEVPDADADGIIDDLAAAHGYQATVFDNHRVESPNPVDKVTFIKQQIGANLFQKIVQARANAAAQTAHAAAVAASQDIATAVTVS